MTTFNETTENLDDLAAQLNSASTESAVAISNLPTKEDVMEVTKSPAVKVNSAEDKRKTFLEKWPEILGSKGTIEELLADDFVPLLGDEEQVRVDISVVVKPDGSSSVMKIKPSVIKSPIFVTSENTEGVAADYTSFEKRGYNKKKD